MSATRVVHVDDGVPGAVYVGRPSLLGNPHPIGRECRACSTFDTPVIHGRGEAVHAYREKTFPELVRLWGAEILKLKGLPLECHCRHEGEPREKRACHADVIADWLERQP